MKKLFDTKSDGRPWLFSDCSVSCDTCAYITDDCSRLYREPECQVEASPDLSAHRKHVAQMIDDRFPLPMSQNKAVGWSLESERHRRRLVFVDIIEARVIERQFRIEAHFQDGSSYVGWTAPGTTFGLYFRVGDDNSFYDGRFNTDCWRSSMHNPNRSF